MYVVWRVKILLLLFRGRSAGDQGGSAAWDYWSWEGVWGTGHPLQLYPDCNHQSPSWYQGIFSAWWLFVCLQQSLHCVLHLFQAWTLDRSAFQTIMMNTGIIRQSEHLNFLKRWVKWSLKTIQLRLHVNLHCTTLLIFFPSQSLCIYMYMYDQTVVWWVHTSGPQIMCLLYPCSVPELKCLTEKDLVKIADALQEVKCPFSFNRVSEILTCSPLVSITKKN